jgi:hypothetical protein
LEVDTNDAVPPLGISCKARFEKEADLDQVVNAGVEVSAAAHPKKSVYLKDIKVDVDRLNNTPQFKIMQAWASKLIKSGDSTVSAQILNKKMLEDVKKSLAGKIDACMSQGQCDLTFPPHSKELKTNLFSYHIVNFAAGHFQLNVSPFCLPEVRLQMVGSSLVVGLKISAIPGDRFYMEEFYVMRSPVLSDLNAWQRS